MIKKKIAGHYHDNYEEIRAKGCQVLVIRSRDERVESPIHFPGRRGGFAEIQ